MTASNAARPSWWPSTSLIPWDKADGGEPPGPVFLRSSSRNSWRWVRDTVRPLTSFDLYRLSDFPLRIQAESVTVEPSPATRSLAVLAGSATSGAPNAEKSSA